MRLRRIIKQLGIIDGGLYLTGRLAGKLPFIGLSLNKYYFVSQILCNQALLPESKGRGLGIIELPRTANVHPCPRPADVIVDRYKQGAVCLAAYKNDDFTGCLWFVKSAYQEDEVRCRYELPALAVWDFDVYVEPKFRLSPVFLKLWDTASSKLLAEGFCWSFSRISAFNAMSLSSHKRMGAKVIGWAAFMRIVSVQVTIASLRPFFHISFSENSFPVFRLQLPES